MNRHEGYARITMLEARIARCVMTGEIGWARSTATEIALLRDSMPTGPEFLACIAAR